MRRAEPPPRPAAPRFNEWAYIFPFSLRFLWSRQVAAELDEERAEFEAYRAGTQGDLEESLRAHDDSVAKFVEVRPLNPKP